ncbi:MAG TPA: TPM domain-containing protein [Methylomirabilota bacterium]|nr:TPM domain-containing protein [Methylomirabilota bacterium]
MRRAALALVLAAAAVVPVLALEVPRLERRVTDLAGLFSASAAQTMEAELERLEAETGAQVAVLTIPSLEGQPLEDYSLRVVEAWQLGREDRDNGVLVLIARDDRRIRIEVGYGLEGVLPDALCGRIIDHAMKPAFRQGDFSGGTRQAVEVIAAAVRGDPDAAAAVAAPEAAAPELGTMIAMGAVFLAVIGTFAMSALFTKGAAAWFLYLFLVPFLFALPSAILGARWGGIAVLAWLVGFPILRALIWHTGAGRRFRTSHPAWTTWTSRGGSWGGGGFSGGGFSGGGGSFGGGGASGGW